MKTLILAGGFGTRLAEETDIRPKPMVEIGGIPIIWHIMNWYLYYGHSEFVVGLGYKGVQIKRFFADYPRLRGNLRVDLASGSIHPLQDPEGRGSVELVETGTETQTGGRLKRCREFLGNQTFMMTYGDGLCDVNISALIGFHRAHGRLATLTAVRPPARFGGLHIKSGIVTEFYEKQQTTEGWINGGFFVLEPGVFDYIDDDMTPWERSPLERLSKDGQLMAFQHEGFWQPMDTLRERRILEEIWASGSAPWTPR